MNQNVNPKRWWKFAIVIATIGFILSFTNMHAGKVLGGAQSSAAGFSWEYQLDFSAPSLQNANQQASSLSLSLDNQGVASELQALGDSYFRLTMTGDQGIEQVRQVLYSPLLAGFIHGAVEFEVNMPVSSLLDTTIKLDSNLTTGYRWDIVPSENVGFAQAGESTFTAQSEGYGVPNIQTLVLHPKDFGDQKVTLTYHRPFEPDATATRHLSITFAAQETDLDLSNPHPNTISTRPLSSESSNGPNPIDEIQVTTVLPESLDWRDSGIVPAPRDQSTCGSCWAFGTVGVMESAIAKAGGPMTDLSEQFLVSCNTYDWGCDGGLTAHYWHYDTLGINQTTIGAVLEADKPYTASDGTCSEAYTHPYTLSGWDFIVPNEYTVPTDEAIKNAIYTYGPITAGICAGDDFSGYETGIFSTDETADCPGEYFHTNHQIILVGWNDIGGYWILRNSWGSGWGESGYMRIAYGTSTVGEGTSWVTWVGPGPAPFSKISPADSSTGQPDNPTLSWESSSGAASYEYCLDTSVNSTCDTSWISTTTNTSIPLSGLTPGVYSWQARAINPSSTTEANNGTWWSFTVSQTYQVYIPLVVENSPVPPPGDFNKSLPANGATDQPIDPNLSWGTSSDAASYDYCIDTINNNTCDTAWISTTSNTSIGLIGLAPTTSYYWQARAVNPSGTTLADSGTWWSFSTLTPSPGIINGDFESGRTDWTEYSLQGWVLIYHEDDLPVSPHSGSYAAWLGWDHNEISYIEQQVTITSGAPYLVYWHWIASEDECGYDFGFVLVDGAVEDVYELCITNNTYGWVAHSVNLSAYIGQSVTLQIRVETDSSFESNLLIDDVSLEASASKAGKINYNPQNWDPSTTQGKDGIVIR